MNTNFNQIFEELDALLIKKASDELDPVVVNGMRGSRGSQSHKISEKAKGDASLRYPRKDGDTITSQSKPRDYPDPYRTPKKDSQEIPQSMIGDKDMGMEDEPKKAAYRARHLIDSIDKLISNQLDKRASVGVQDQVDQLALQKAAAYEQGQVAFSNWRNYIDKFAADRDNDAPTNSPEHRGDLADTAVATLIDRTDPHSASDGRSPEAKPASSGDKEAQKLQKGKDSVDAELEAKASMLMAKATLYDNLLKAAEANDSEAVVAAKADIVDFVREYGV